MYGVKTGFTNGANRCLVTSCKRGDMDIISVVLGADTKKDRTKDSIKIIEYAFENYKMIDIGYMVHERFDKLVEGTDFNVYKGINSNLTIGLEGEEIGLYPIDKTKVKDIKVNHEIETDLISPVLKGEKLRETNCMDWRR